MRRLATETKLSNLLAFSFMVVVFAPWFAGAVPEKYFTRTWQVEQGLPQNKVTAVVQTRDGYLWVGTYNGLARFDGVRFTVFNDNNTPQLGSSRITSLFEGDDGVLWIATENGDLSQLRNGCFSNVPVRAKWKGGKIYAITADETGAVWLLNESGELARVSDGRIVSPASGYVVKVLSFSRGEDGTLWINREGVVSSLKAGRLTEEVSTNEYVQGICAARDGGTGNGLRILVRHRGVGGSSTLCWRLPPACWRAALQVPASG
jgi:ligand-binding sensor domain-containing protein